jgi:WD40 repeat protein
MVSPLDSKVMLADMAISPDGQQLATMARLNGQPGDPDCEVRVWDPRRGKEVLCFKRPPAPRLDDVAFAGNERLALRHAAGGIEICDSTTGRSIATLPQLVQNVAVSPDGRQIAARAFLNQKPHLCIWDAATGREVASYPADVEGGFGKPTLVYSPDGLFLAAPKAWRGGPQPLHPIALRLAATGKEVLVMKGHSGLVNALAFSPDGKRLVSGSEDQTLKVWDLATGQALLTLRGHQDGVRTVAFSPDGRRIASATRSEVRLWDAPPESADEERRKFEIGPPEGR